MRRMMCVTPLVSRATDMQLARVLVSAMFAGVVAGLIAALLQFMFVQPVLLHAELYESGELVHFGSAAVSANPELPGFDALRDGMSILFSALVYTGYALILIALMSIAEQRGHEITPRNGMLWGLAGFIAFHFAPGLSLSPEVPGVASADLGLRQIWWFSTVISAGLAMWLLAFGKNRIAYGIAALLLLAPHVIGAPMPSTFTGPVPTEIGSLFAARAFGVGMASWVILGTCAGYFWNTEGARQTAIA
jgi:cobalt transporter subunit CbtA